MMNRRHLSIRARLILLVLAVVLPAAGLVAWLIVAEARDARYVAFIGIADLLLALALAHRIASAISKPVRELARTSAKIANGDVSARACIAGPAEIASVARQFNRMLDV